MLRRYQGMGVGHVVFELPIMAGIDGALAAMKRFAKEVRGAFAQGVKVQIIFTCASKHRVYTWSLDVHPCKLVAFTISCCPTLEFTGWRLRIGNGFRSWSLA